MRNLVLITIICGLILLFIEGMLFVSYMLTNGHRNFASRAELQAISYKATSLPYRHDAPLRLATYGGSTAAGYTSVISVAFLLGNALSLQARNSQSQPLPYVVTHARNGHPFLDGQSKLLELALDYFDVFFVYAGHNEYMALLNVSDRESPGTIIGRLPWKRSTAWLDRYVQETAAEFQTHQKLTRQLINNWRTLNFATKIGLRLSRGYRVFEERISDNSETRKETEKNRQNNSVVPAPKFIVPEKTLTRDEILAIPSLYKKRVEEIIGKLGHDKSIVFSTVLSNDLWPPLFEQGTSTRDIETLIGSGYDKFFNGNFGDLAKTLRDKRFPKGPHYYWLKGMLRLRTGEFKSERAWEYLRLARNEDASVFRVLTAVNEVIRSFENKYPNVHVIDSVKKLFEVTNSEDEYWSYFLDFQHLSPKGQLFIAGLVMEELGYESAKVLPVTVDACGVPKAYAFFNGLTKVLPEELYKVCRQEIEISSNWLQEFTRHVREDRPFLQQKVRIESVLEGIISK